MLLIAASGVLIGRAWQFISRGNPILSLCYDQRFAKYFVEQFTAISWSDYQANFELSQVIENIIIALGCLLIFNALVLIFQYKSPKLLSWTISYCGSFMLFILAIAYYIDKGFAFGQFIEYALQMASPLLFLSYIHQRFSLQSFILTLKVLIALTFIGHGLYAVDYYPQPGHFVQMMIHGFGLGEATAKIALQCFGYLDFIAVFILFLPDGKKVKIALIYMILWGFLTTLARLYTNFYWEMPLDSLIEWLPDFLYRLNHFIIPLVLYILLKDSDKTILFHHQKAIS